MGWFGDSSKGSTLPLKIYFFISLGISIAYIVMGVKYYHDCTAEPMIPIYLIVMGALTIASSLWRLVLNKALESFYDVPKITVIVIFVIIALTSFAWFIAGNVFIYRLKGKYEPKDVEASNYCNNDFYLFAFWSVTVNYIAMGNVFIYRLKGKYEPEDVEASNYCNNDFYLFAFWSVTVNYIAMGVLILFTCCQYCCCKRK